MSRTNVILILYLILFSSTVLSGAKSEYSGSVYETENRSDTIYENQILYNGRMWRNLYYQVEGNQFLFSNEFLPGTLTINGKTFSNIGLKYDIFKDELLTPLEPGGVLQLNKEMVDSFSLGFQNVTYRFIRVKEDSTDSPKGYFNVLYNYKTALYVKYCKKIDKLSTDGQYDNFYQFTRLYFVRGNKSFLVTGKSDLLNVMNDNKPQIKEYIKKNNLNISVKIPESFIRVLEYYDSLSQ
jgi:hypothetical protein